MTNEKESMSQRVSVAILDDDQRVALTIRSFLKPLKCNSTIYTDPQRCLDAIAQQPVDILITDLCMPGLSGLDVLELVRKTSPETDVIVVTGTAGKDEAIRALKLGAFDFFEKPVNPDEITLTISRTLRYRQIERERDLLATQVSLLSEQERVRCGVSGLVSHSPAMKKIMHDVQLVCRAPSTSVLITGESGTGKELIARAIHYGSARAGHAFVAINSSAVPPDLAESTLFGHVRGAFTGAVAERKGCFELADGGTLFLDEIGDMAPEMQTKLLRVLEDGEVTPVGSPRARQVNVRIVAATNADIAGKIGIGKFRSDLYYRLAGFTISLPPLRQRKVEIPLLAEHFNRLISREMGFPCPALDDTALAVLVAYDFPGNIRELRNIIERALIESHGSTIRAGHIHCGSLSAGVRQTNKNESAEKTAPLDCIPVNLKDAEAAVIRRALASTGGNISEAARMLGVNRPKLYRMMAAQSIDSH